MERKNTKSKNKKAVQKGIHTDMGISDKRLPLIQKSIHDGLLKFNNKSEFLNDVEERDEFTIKEKIFIGYMAGEILGRIETQTERDVGKRTK